MKVAAFATMLRVYLTIGVRIEWDPDLDPWHRHQLAVLSVRLSVLFRWTSSDFWPLLIAHELVLIGVLYASEVADSVMFYLLGYGIAAVGAWSHRTCSFADASEHTVKQRRSRQAWARRAL